LQDDFQHVNNVTYLKWFETARVNMFHGYNGFEGFMSNAGVGPIIRSVELAWRYPITYPDKITVVHKLLPLREKDRFELQGVVVSHNAKKVAARIKEVIVIVDYNKGGVKAMIPEYVFEAFNDRLQLQQELAPAAA
jgi:YbgC/YbaW family acyl-CoA thioester hydrolase